MLRQNLINSITKRISKNTGHNSQLTFHVYIDHRAFNTFICRWTGTNRYVITVQTLMPSVSAFKEWNVGNYIA